MTKELQPAYPGHISEFARRMAQKGLSVARLATESGVGEKTIRRILNGGRSFPSTYRELAKVLATEQECHLLMNASNAGTGQPKDEEESDDDGPYLTCTIRIAVRGKNKPESEALCRALHDLAGIIQQKGIVIVDKTRAGSLIADLLVSDVRDVHAMVRAFCNLSLYEHGIDALTIPAHIDIKEDVLTALATRTLPFFEHSQVAKRLQWTVLTGSTPFQLAVNHHSSPNGNVILQIDRTTRNALSFSIFYFELPSVAASLK